MKTEKQLLEIVEELMQETINEKLPYSQKTQICSMLTLLKKDIAEILSDIRKIKKP